MSHFLDMQTHNAEGWIFLLQCLCRWGLFPQCAAPMWANGGSVKEAAMLCLWALSSQQLGWQEGISVHLVHAWLRLLHRKEEAGDWNVTFWVTVHTQICPWAMQLHIFLIQGSCWLCDLNKFQRLLFMWLWLDKLAQWLFYRAAVHSVECSEMLKRKFWNNSFFIWNLVFKL